MGIMWKEELGTATPSFYQNPLNPVLVSNSGVINKKRFFSHLSFRLCTADAYRAAPKDPPIPWMSHHTSAFCFWLTGIPIGCILSKLCILERNQVLLRRHQTQQLAAS